MWKWSLDSECVYTGIDKTCLDTSSGSFNCDPLYPRHIERNYVPLFGVAQSNVDLRYYVIRDVIGFFNIVVERTVHLLCHYYHLLYYMHVYHVCIMCTNKVIFLLYV